MAAGDALAIPFATSSYRSATLAISAQQLINFYAEIQSRNSDAKAPVPLIGSPGLISFGDVGAGPIRALIEMDDLLYAISGSSLYAVNSAGVGTALGAGIQPGANVLGISENGTQILTVDGVRGFTYNPGTLTYAQILDADFRASKTVTFLNSYFLLPALGTNEFFSSDSDDGTSYDATFFASAETNSDDVEAVLAHQQQAYITGHKGIEIWQFNPNTSNFPWNRYPGAAIQTGTAGPFAAKVHKEKIFYVGSDAKFYRLDGAEPVSIIDPGVASQWASYGDISDVFLMSMTWDDHEWIVITFPTANHTWIYDQTTGFFHERASYDSMGNSLGRWRANAYAKCYGKHLIGDAFTGKIGYLSASAYDEYGTMMPAIAVSPTLHNPGGKVFLSSLELLMQVGVGLLTGQGSDPKVFLDWSDDDGRTWSTFQLSASMGIIGDYKAIVRFTQLGSFASRIFRLTITDPVKRVVMSAIPKVQGGMKYS